MDNKIYSKLVAACAHLGVFRDHFKTGNLPLEYGKYGAMALLDKDIEYIKDAIKQLKG